jgi:hypothetical protein
MKKRDFAAEIKALRERSEFNTRFDMSYRLNMLQDIIDSYEIDSAKDIEFLKYFPIKLVAIIESHFRSTVKLLIDHGDPFLKNIPKLNQPNDGKIPIHLLLSLNASEFTLGELIAHVLPSSKLGDMESALNILTEKDLFHELKNFLPETIFEHNKAIAEFYVSLEPLIKRDLIEVYRLRNIFCHELGATEDLKPEKIGLLVKSVSLYVNHLDNYIMTLVYPNNPETTADINNALGHDFRQTEDKLIELINKIEKASDKIKSPNYERVRFNLAQQHWQNFREETSRMAAHSCEGGNMYLQLYLSEMIKITETRLKDLSYHFQYELENFNKLNKVDK